MAIKKVFIKRFSCFLLAFSLAFGTCYADYQKVYALEWAVSELSLEYLLSMLLGVLGVSVLDDTLNSDDWENIAKSSQDFMINKGISDAEVSNWWANALKGSVSTVSECWSAFKEWVNSILNNQVISYDYNFLGISAGSTTIENAIHILCNYYDLDYNSFIYATENSSDKNRKVQSFFMISYSGYLSIWFSISDSALSISDYYKNNRLEYNNSYFQYVIIPTLYNVGSYPSGFVSGNLLDLKNGDYDIYLSGSRNAWFNNTSGSVADVFCFNISNFDSLVNNEYFNFYNGLPTYKDLYNSLSSDVTGLDVVNSNITDLDNTDGFSLPTDENSVSSLQDLIDAVNAGTMDLTDYIEAVQDLTDTIAYEDTETGENVLVPENEVTPTLNDVISANTDNLSFTLSGLEKVFPFCIPFDIKDFVSLLVADPVAPVIEYPILNPITKENEIITLDFSVWEPVVIVVRYVFDFLLIIGLLLLARSLIGAGGSD